MPTHLQDDRNAIELTLLKEYFQQAPSFMAVLSGKHHVFELANRTYYQLVGHRDILGKPVGEALPEITEQGFVDLLDSVFQTGKPFVGREIKVLLQMEPDAPLAERFLDFVYQPRVNAEGEVEGIFVHGVDVTDLVVSRQESEARALQIKQQSQTLDTLVSGISDFVYTFDREGRFTYSNKPLLNLLGITLDEIVGKSFHELPYPEDLATTLQAHIQHVVETKAQIVAETPYDSPTGVHGYYEYIFSPVLGEDGEVVVVAGSTRDITERKLQERQKDDFLAIVSHELKTPITSLKAHVQMLQRMLAKDGQPRTAAYLAKMDAQTNKLTALIGDLLDVTIIERGRMRFNYAEVAFDDVVAEAIDEVQRTTERHAIVSQGVSNRVIYADRDRVGQVLINLLNNAVKYSVNADTIVVTSGATDDAVTLSVQDFGEGISADAQPHIFERFYRAPDDTHAAVPGLGLGLYVSAEIVRRHGGTITVESAPGRGATFSLSLPLRPSDESMQS